MNSFIQSEMAKITNISNVERLYSYFNEALKEENRSSDEKVVKILKLHRHICLLRILELKEGYTFFDMPVDIVASTLHKIHESNEPYVKFWIHRYERLMM